MIFGKIYPEKILYDMLQICPPHLSDVATLPWEIQKSHFQQYYSYIKILIIYVISEENKLQSTCSPHLKCHHTNL